jgi:hypothetical protein
LIVTGGKRFRMQKRLNNKEEKEDVHADAWTELKKHAMLVKEIVENKHKRKLERQEKQIKEYELRIQAADEQGDTYASLYNKAKAQSALLLKKVEELETALHSITSGESVDMSA